MTQEVIIGTHGHQPSRQASHERLKGISTDPGGHDWTHRIGRESYTPKTYLGSWDSASFDLSPQLLSHELPRLVRQYSEPGVIQTIQAAKAALPKWGVAHPYGHCINGLFLPPTQEINLRAGLEAFVRASGGVRPRFVWLPEAALDTPTLELVAKYFEGTICAPWQVQLRNGEPADNQPAKVNLPSGRSTVVVPFDTTVAWAMGFGQRDDANRFVEQYILPRMNGHAPNEASKKRLISWVDTEFGHHKYGGEGFYQYLVTQALTNYDLEPRSINELDLTGDLPEAIIIEGSSWSCSHPKFKRWKGECDCGIDREKGQSGEWRRPFFLAHQALVDATGGLVRQQLGWSQGDYIDFMAKNLGQLVENSGGQASTADKSLLSATSSAIFANTSCGTFFGSPDTSGRINVVYALQSLQHLWEGGLENEARSLKHRYLGRIYQVWPEGAPLAGREWLDQAVSMLDWD